MLVRYFIEVPVPLETAVGAVSDPGFWGHALDPELEPGAHVLLARFGIQGLCGHPSEPVHLRVGVPTHQPRGTIIDVQWRSGAGSGADPVMQADVTLSALGSRLVHLEFNGCYCGPGVLSAAPADRMMQHRVLEYAVRMILLRTARGLTVTPTEVLG